MKNQKESANKIRFRTIGIFILGGVILFSGLAIWDFTQDTPPPEHFFWALLAIAMLCVFVSSIFVIKYKEMPRTGGLPSITGPVAVAGGLLSLLLSGFGFVYSVYEVVSRILK
jgi:hypothetical protein